MDKIRKERNRPDLGQLMQENVMLLVFLAFFAYSVFFVDNFTSVYNLKNFLKNCAPLLIASIGLTLVTLNGGIDFSITSVISLGSVVSSHLLVQSGIAGKIYAIPVVLLIVIGMGTVFGLINGLSVSKLKMPSFVATLAMQLIGAGMAVWLGNILFNGVVSLGGLPDTFCYLGGKGDKFWVPIVIAAVVFLLFDWLTGKTVFGKQVYAIGVNPKTAEVSGVPVKRNICLLFVISGCLSGLASLMYTAKNGAGVPTLGETMFIDIVGSVVIGGTNPAGGFGGVRNTLYGVLFLTLVSNILNLTGIEWYFVDLIKGGLVIAAVVLNLLFKSVGNKNVARA